MCLKYKRSIKIYSAILVIDTQVYNNLLFTWAGIFQCDQTATENSFVFSRSGVGITVWRLSLIGPIVSGKNSLYQLRLINLSSKQILYTLGVLILDLRYLIMTKVLGVSFFSAVTQCIYFALEKIRSLQILPQRHLSSPSFKRFWIYPDSTLLIKMRWWFHCVIC